MNEAFTLSQETILRSGIIIHQTTSDDGIRLKPTVPSSHRFPREIHAERSDTTEVGTVGSVDSISQDRLRELRENFGFSPVGDWVRDFEPNSDSEWTFSKETPPEVIAIFKKALTHEAALYPDLKKRVCHISMRLVDAKTYNENWLREEHREWQPGYSDIHFDFGKKNMSSYIVGSEPTTIFYGKALEGQAIDSDMMRMMETSRNPANAVEKYGISAKSMRPWHMTRMDERTPHSQPWGAMESRSENPLRFIIRLQFSDKEE